MDKRTKAGASRSPPAKDGMRPQVRRSFERTRKRHAKALDRLAKL